ncbi:putative cell division protein WhiA [Trichinella pseudospiralis]
MKTVKGVAKLSQDHSKRIQDRAGFVDPVVSFDRPITRLPAKLVGNRKNRSITIGRFCFLVQPVSTSFTRCCHFPRSATNNSATLFHQHLIFTSFPFHATSYAKHGRPISTKDKQK